MSTSSIWLWFTHPEALSNLVASAPCGCSRSSKRWRYLRGKPALTALLLARIWRRSLDRMSPMRFLMQMTFARTVGVHGDSWTSPLILRVRESQSANFHNWHLVLRKFWLLQEKLWTRRFSEVAMNISLSSRCVWRSRRKFSMSHSA